MKFWRHRKDEELDAEIQYHLDEAIRDRMERGETPDEARLNAQREFGNVGLVKEVTREMWGWAWLEELGQDLRFGARMLAKQSSFTLIAALTLALGIGVNTALFTTFDAVALKSIPVKNPETVVRVERWFESHKRGNVQYLFSYPEYVYFREHNRVFSDLIAASGPLRVIADVSPATSAGANASRESERLDGQMVSANYFSGLGVNAAIGRTFLPDENQTPRAHPVVVLSHLFWQRRFNAAPSVLGKNLLLNGTAFTVVGVAASDFIGTGNPPQVPDFWVPLMMQSQLEPGRDWLNLSDAYRVQLLARRKPGIGVAPAQAEVGGLAYQFAQGSPVKDKTIALTLEPATFFGETNDIRFQAFVALLMAIVGMVLLIACANLANMLLARSAGRQREIGIRLALGASRGRLIRQLLTESVLLALLGGAAGVLLSVWVSQLLWIAIEQALQGFMGSCVMMTVPLAPDVRVFGYALLLSLATGIIFGLAPALQLSRPDLTTALKAEGSTFGQRLQGSRLRNLLVGGQVAVSMVLLISAGLLVRGLLRSQTADAGFETRSVFMVDLGYGSDAENAVTLQRRVIQRLETLPELKSVAEVERFPLAATWTPPILVEETKALPEKLPSRTLANYVSKSYFPTLGIPIVRGRNFAESEGQASAPVAIISEATARQLWPGEDALGKWVKLDLDFQGKLSEFEVIGIAKDVRTTNVSRVDPTYFYLPIKPTQLNNLLIRIQGDHRKASEAIRSSLAAVEPNLLPSFTMTSLEEGPLRVQRMMTSVYARFAVMLAGLALVLAAIGIYGVMAYLVSQRTREIGIRIALGATRHDVLRVVLWQGLRPVIAGATIGLACSAAVSSLLHAALTFPGVPDPLFGVGLFDPITFAGLSCFLVGIALLASFVPARRAMKVDPLIALRHE